MPTHALAPLHHACRVLAACVFLSAADAGHYVPSIAKYVFDANINPPPGDVRINLKGVAIGNGEAPTGWRPLPISAVAATAHCARM